MFFLLVHRDIISEPSSFFSQLFHIKFHFVIIFSYDRIQPNTWSGAFQCWGKENREAAIRTASPPGAPDGLVTNFEIKTCDGAANPHLSLAIIMAAGIDGLRRHLQLPEPIGNKNFLSFILIFF